MSASDKKKLRKEQVAATLTEKQQLEQKEAKKLKTYTLTFAVIMILVVAIVVGVAVRSPIMSAVNQNTNAISFGEHKLTTVDFSYYYVDAISKHYNDTYNSYAETFGNYWTMFLGFDTGKPLDEQFYDSDKKSTWAHKFVEVAIKDATEIYALYDEAVKNNHKLSENEQKALDALAENMKTLATDYGFSNANEYLRVNYGDGANLENYTHYCTVTTYASSFAAAYSESLEYTNEELREYEKDKFLDYTKFDYCYYLINVNKYLGEGTKDENGNVTYTDQQRADALLAAKKDADALINSGATDAEKFDKAVQSLVINKDNKDAACDKVTGTFYDEITYAEIREWLSEDDRKVNDFESVPLINKPAEGEEGEEETVGYLVILYQGRDDCYTNLVSVRHILSEFNYVWDTDFNKTLPDSSKEKSKKEAEEWFAAWKAGGATEESFAKLANEKSDDGDGTTGGLYESVYPNQTLKPFNDWCFDKDRKPGDTEIIETEYGYHIMYFVETEEETFRDLLIKADMVNEDSNEWLESLTKDYKVEQINLKGLQWDYVVKS